MDLNVNFNSKFIKLPLLLMFMSPLLMAVWQFYKDMLGANSIEEITHITGEWALRLLLITLAISPARKIFRINGLINLRRLFGVLCFFYVFCHLLIYAILDQWLDWPAIIDDIKDRPYVTVGFAAFVLLIPLAITSTDSMQRKLQGDWVKLHKLIYVISILAILHFWWLVKADLFEPIIYASILAVLLGYRVFIRVSPVQ
jgi:sulfoxide reductase heme-binding subunit YedZ|tara:strand:- start:675 stop:1274 length:600 start_codon:yes stop_codon:yes gene_type:complete